MLRAQKAHRHADKAIAVARHAAAALMRTRPLDGAMGEAALAVAEGRLEAAEQGLTRWLADAPPGFAGWTLPIDPLLRQLHGRKGFAAVLGRLVERAR